MNRYPLLTVWFSLIERRTTVLCHAVIHYTYARDVQYAPYSREHLDKQLSITASVDSRSWFHIRIAEALLVKEDILEDAIYSVDLCRMKIPCCVLHLPI